MFYNVIIHLEVSHAVLVNIRNNWDGGIGDGDKAPIGVIRQMVGNTNVAPLVVDLSAGSLWIGFKYMILLGMQHIAEGTDHLMFLLVLLLPALFLVMTRRWDAFGGNKYSLSRLLAHYSRFN